MATFVNKLIDAYNYVNYDLADPRMNNFFLISSPWTMLAITWFYLYFSTSFGPRYMKNRPPFNLKNIVAIYNLFQICFSTYIFYEGMVYITSEKFKYSCDPIDYSEDPRTMRLATACWCYFFAKVTEFLDTIFFVLRKKNNQISFLHVYHHSLMAISTWLGVKYVVGGHAVLMGTLNSLVHIVMYTYYLIAGLGPQYQKYVWWKKHVTVIQLVQFVIILIHSLNPLLFTECSYPKFLNIVISFNSLLFINLFGRFFINSYIRRKPIGNKIIKNGTSTNGVAKNGTSNGVAKNGTSNGVSYSEKMTNGSNGVEIVLNGKFKNA